jgi:hypothetical protein
MVRIAITAEACDAFDDISSLLPLGHGQLRTRA